MTNYRVDYTQVVPGGTQYRQSEIVRGERRDVVIYLGSVRGLLAGSVEVFESTMSDQTPKSIGSLGF